MKVPRQETFDRVARALAQQGAPAWRFADGGAWPSCTLLDEQGRRCAVGHLLPRDMSPARIRELDHRAVDEQLFSLAEDHDMRLVLDLRSAHDTAFTCAGEDGWLGRWADEMRAVSRTWSLNTTELERALAARAP